LVHGGLVDQRLTGTSIDGEVTGNHGRLL
jgi:hypothetical protein